MSDSFSFSNGVRQGGILSPCLFGVYMDDLSKKLNNVNVGCFMGTELINNLMYADDLGRVHTTALGPERNRATVFTPVPLNPVVPE